MKTLALAMSDTPWSLYRMKEAVESPSITIPQGLKGKALTQFILKAKNTPDKV